MSGIPDLLMGGWNPFLDDLPVALAVVPMAVPLVVVLRLVVMSAGPMLIAGCRLIHRVDIPIPTLVLLQQDGAQDGRPDTDGDAFPALALNIPGMGGGCQNR